MQPVDSAWISSDGKTITISVRLSLWTVGQALSVEQEGTQRVANVRKFARGGAARRSEGGGKRLSRNLFQRRRLLSLSLTLPLSLRPAHCTRCRFSFFALFTFSSSRCTPCLSSSFVSSLPCTWRNAKVVCNLCLSFGASQGDYTRFRSQHLLCPSSVALYRIEGGRRVRASLPLCLGPFHFSVVYFAGRFSRRPIARASLSPSARPVP